MLSELLMNRLPAWQLARCFVLGMVLPIANCAQAQETYGGYGHDPYSYAELDDDWRADYGDYADEGFDRLEDDFGYDDAYGDEGLYDYGADYDHDYYVHDYDYGIDYNNPDGYAGDTDDEPDEGGLGEAYDADDYFGSFDEDLGYDYEDLGYDYDDLGYGDRLEPNYRYYDQRDL